MLLAMMLIIVADVLLRNVAVPGLPRGLPWSNEISELMLYLITLCVAPWLLRQGQHIRVDIVLQRASAAPGLEPRVGRRRARPRLLRGDGLVRRAGGVVELRRRARSTSRRWSRRSGGRWLPLPVVFVLLAIEMVFRMVRLQRAERAPRARRGERRMTPGPAHGARSVSSWALAAWLMLGGSTVLLFIGMPVALTFIAINIVGAWLYMGGEAGLVQLARSSVSSITAFSLTPIPLFVLMGEVLFHTGLALQGDRRHRAADPPRAGPARGGGGGRGHRVLGDLRLDHRHHRDARLADAAGDARARLPPDARDRADHGDRRGRHADPAVGADGAARLAVGHLDLQAADRRRGARADPVDRLRAVDRRARAASRRALRRTTATPVVTRGWARWQPFFGYVLPCLSIFGVVVGALAAGWATPTECAALGAFATHGARRRLSRADLRARCCRRCKGTAAISGMILFIILGATTFAQILSFSGASNGLVQTHHRPGPVHRRDRGRR